jgi:hypothetical protein
MWITFHSSPRGAAIRGSITGLGEVYDHVRLMVTDLKYLKLKGTWFI